MKPRNRKHLNERNTKMVKKKGEISIKEQHKESFKEETTEEHYSKYGEILTPLERQNLRQSARLRDLLGIEPRVKQADTESNKDSFLFVGTSHSLTTMWIFTCLMLKLLFIVIEDKQEKMFKLPGQVIIKKSHLIINEVMDYVHLSFDAINCNDNV